jgi:hypothetical protein
MKKIIQAILGIAVVLMFVSGADAGGGYFYLTGNGNDDCVGVQLTLNGTSYTVHKGETVPVCSNITEGTNVTVKLVRLGGYSYCGGNVHEYCKENATFKHSSTSSPITICSGQDVQAGVGYSLTYTRTISSNTSCQSTTRSTSYDVNFTANTTTTSAY